MHMTVPLHAKYLRLVWSYILTSSLAPLRSVSGVFCVDLEAADVGGGQHLLAWHDGSSCVSGSLGQLIAQSWVRRINLVITHAVRDHPQRTSASVHRGALGVQRSAKRYAGSTKHYPSTARQSR